MEYNEEVILTIIIGYLNNESQFYRSSKDFKNARKKCSRFSETLKITL